MAGSSAASPRWGTGWVSSRAAGRMAPFTSQGIAAKLVSSANPGTKHQLLMIFFTAELLKPRIANHGAPIRDRQPGNAATTVSSWFLLDFRAFLCVFALQSVRTNHHGEDQRVTGAQITNNRSSMSDLR